MKGRVGLASLALLLGLSAWSLAAPGLAGSAEGTGTAQAWWIFGRSIRGTVSIKEGKQVTFSFRYASRKYRRLESMTFVGPLKDGKVAFRQTVTGGVVGELGSGGESGEVLFSGPLTVSNGKLTMNLKAKKSRKLQSYSVKGISFSGPWKDSGGAVSADDESGVEEDADRVRLKIGRDGEAFKPGKKYEVIVPLAGKLTISVGSGAVTITRPNGDKVEGNELEISDDQLGSYTVAIKDGGGTVAAAFEQVGRIDPKIRPWSSHTYYPLYKLDDRDDEDADENEDTMFRAGGPLAKLDKALGLTGSSSAQDWEINGYGNRTSLGLENGHYTRVEELEEETWISDANFNGMKSYAQVRDYMKAFDSDGDGKVTKGELMAGALDNAAARYFSSYDSDGSGAIDGTEINADFVKRSDRDNDSKLDGAEWAAALKKDHRSALDRFAKPEVEKALANDSDGDGVLVKGEVSGLNGLDVIDSGDKDDDGREYYDQDNIVLVMKDGTKQVGNKLDQSGSKYVLFKGYKKDEKVGSYKKSAVKEVRRGVADGELTGSYSVGWWGHCNAWAMAAIMFQVPKEELANNGVTFNIRDQKALLIELSMRDTSDATFWWKQWSNKDEMPDKKYAAGFHEQLKRFLRDEQKGLMADMDFKPIRQTTGFQVWNYPLLGYVASVREADGNDPYVLELEVEIQKGSYADENSEGTADVTYTLHFSESGGIRSDDAAKTDWTTTSGFGDDGAKAYIRYLMHPRGLSGSLGSGNPRVTEERLQKIFGGKLKRNSLEAVEAATGD